MFNSKLRKILVKNTGVQMVTHIVNLAMGLLVTMMLSRYLGVEKFGMLNYVFAFYFFFLALSDFGVNTVVIREISKAKDKAAEIIGTVFSFKILIAIFSMAVAWILISTLDYGMNLRKGLFIYSFILLAVTLQLPGVIFRVLLKMEYPSLFAFIKSLLNLAIVLVVLSREFGVETLLMGYVFCEFFVSAITILFSRKYTKIKFQVNLRILKKILKSSILIGTTGLFVALISRVDFIMVGQLRDVAELGLYSAAYRITALTESLPMMVMATFFPLMSEYVATDLGKLKKTFYKSTMLLLFMGIPMGVMVTFLAPVIISLIFGVEFSQAVRGLQILIWSSVCLYASISAGNLLISMHHERISFLIQALAAVLNIGLNFLWIPKTGYIGAAQATVCSFIFIFLATTICAFVFLGRLTQTRTSEL